MKIGSLETQLYISWAAKETSKDLSSFILLTTKAVYQATLIKKGL